jgi:hypothetical protein
MANVFTALVPTLFSAAQEVANEPFGVVSAINTQFDSKGVAVGDNVVVPIAPTRSVTAFTPGATNPAGDAATASSVSVTITNSDKVSWVLTGEQIRSLDNGAESSEWVRQMVAQGMRALRNSAELAASNAVKVGASRAIGTAGTNPFASNLDSLVDVRKVLHDNGAPLTDLQCVINTTAGAALRKQGIIQQAYQAGNEQERRSGELLRQFGFQIRESAGIGLHTKGTGADFVTSGQTAVNVRDVALVTGTGTVIPGDVVTFAADTGNKYVVNDGTSGPGTITLGRPGARMIIPTANALTVGGNYTANLAFERSAVVGIMRPPIMPRNATITTQAITDSMGMTYLLVQLEQYGQTTWEVHLAYGFKVVQGEMVAILLG